MCISLDLSNGAPKDACEEAIQNPNRIPSSPNLPNSRQIQLCLAGIRGFRQGIRRIPPPLPPAAGDDDVPGVSPGWGEAEGETDGCWRQSPAGRTESARDGFRWDRGDDCGGGEEGTEVCADGAGEMRTEEDSGELGHVLGVREGVCRGVFESGARGGACKNVGRLRKRHRFWECCVSSARAAGEINGEANFRYNSNPE